jgi:hypothetical protein
MFMFSPGSRYKGAGAPYQVSRPGRATVLATPLPLPQPAPALGYHQSAGTERLDLLAFRYLADATAFWRICDANNAMVPATLAARALIAIPDAGA